MSADAISAYVEAQLEQAQRDSQGVFTLDPRRAEELLRQLQLAAPHHYILALLAALVGLGATRLDLEVAEGGLKVTAPGASLDPQALANPLAALFSSDSTPALRELAIGVNSGLRYPGALFSLVSWTQDEAIEAQYRAGSYSTQPLSECPRGQGLCLRFFYEKSGQKRFAPEFESVRQAFRHAPLPIVVEGQQVSGPVPVPQTGCAIYCQSDAPQPGGQLECSGSAECLWHYSHPAPLQMLLLVDEALPEPSCHWLVMGRAYEVPFPFDLGWCEEPMHLWISCPSLDRDLSLASLAENERYFRIVQYCRELTVVALEQLCLEVIETGLAPARVSAFKPLLVYALESLCRAGCGDLALRLQECLNLAPGADVYDHYRTCMLRGSAQEVGEILGEITGEDWRSLWKLLGFSLAVHGYRHPTVQSLLGRCAEKALAAGRYSLAIRCLEPYLELQGRTRGASWELYAQALAKVGRCQEAIEAYERALAVPTRGRNDRRGPILEQVALLESGRGRLREAASGLAEVLKLLVAEHGRSSSKLGPTLARLELLCRELGEMETSRHYRIWLDSL